MSEHEKVQERLEELRTYGLALIGPALLRYQTESALLDVALGAAKEHRHCERRNCGTCKSLGKVPL